MERRQGEDNSYSSASCLSHCRTLYINFFSLSISTNCCNSRGRLVILIFILSQQCPQSLLTQALHKKGLALPTMLQLYQKKGDVACSPFVWDGTAMFEEDCVLSQIIALTAYSEYLIGTASIEDDASSEPASSVLKHRIFL